MHNTTGCAVPLTWLFLCSQSKVDLIANAKILVDMRKVWSEDAIRVRCSSGFKIVDRVGDLPGYGNVWYERTGISNILSMSRATNKFWFFSTARAGIILGWLSQTGNRGFS